MADMVEKVAMAIYAGRNGPGAIPWSRLGLAHKSPYRVDARAAIEALRGCGKLAAAAMHESAGCAGWPAEYECECFDDVIDAILKEEGNE